MPKQDFSNLVLQAEKNALSLVTFSSALARNEVISEGLLYNNERLLSGGMVHEGRALSQAAPPRPCLDLFKHSLELSPKLTAAEILGLDVVLKRRLLSEGEIYCKKHGNRFLPSGPESFVSELLGESSSGQALLILLKPYKGEGGVTRVYAGGEVLKVEDYESAKVSGASPFAVIRSWKASTARANPEEVRDAIREVLSEGEPEARLVGARGLSFEQGYSFGYSSKCDCKFSGVQGQEVGEFEFRLFGKTYQEFLASSVDEGLGALGFSPVAESFQLGSSCHELGLAQRAKLVAGAILSNNISGLLILAENFDCELPLEELVSAGNTVLAYQVGGLGDEAWSFEKGSSPLPLPEGVPPTVGLTSIYEAIGGQRVFSEFYASLPAARRLGLRADDFLETCGVCDCEWGRRRACEACLGEGFSTRLIGVEYRGFTLGRVLDTPARELMKAFGASGRASNLLEALCIEGLGGLPLGYPQRLMSASELMSLELLGLTP